MKDNFFHCLPLSNLKDFKNGFIRGVDKEAFIRVIHDSVETVLWQFQPDALSDFLKSDRHLVLDRL